MICRWYLCFGNDTLGWSQDRCSCYDATLEKTKPCWTWTKNASSWRDIINKTVKGTRLGRISFGCIDLNQYSGDTCRIFCDWTGLVVTLAEENHSNSLNFIWYIKGTIFGQMNCVLGVNLEMILVGVKRIGVWTPIDRDWIGEYSITALLFGTHGGTTAAPVDVD